MVWSDHMKMLPSVDQAGKDRYPALIVKPEWSSHPQVEDTILWSRPKDGNEERKRMIWEE